MGLLSKRSSARTAPFEKLLSAYLERRFPEVDPDTVAGVSLAPVHRHKGEVCVLLGREAGGVFKGRLNLIGGKTRDSQSSGWKRVAETLVSETREELYYDLSALGNEAEICSAFTVGFRDRRDAQGNAIREVSVVVVARMAYPPASFAAWEKTRREHISNKSPWKFREMTEIRRVSLRDLGKTQHLRDSVAQGNAIRDVSAYVKTCIDSISRSLPFGI